jgi:hypothetical protein
MNDFWKVSIFFTMIFLLTTNFLFYKFAKQNYEELEILKYKTRQAENWLGIKTKVEINGNYTSVNTGCIYGYADEDEKIKSYPVRCKTLFKYCEDERIKTLEECFQIYGDK